jgi:DNA-binding NarL/FixJ family response regulator
MLFIYTALSSRICASVKDGSIARMVVRSFRTPSKGTNAEGLTSREAEILELLARGLSNKEIADRIHIPPETVRNHLGHVFQKLHVRCRAEAASKFLRTL